jgi:glutamate racemase
MDTSAPIGVFDSGMGGLTVLQAIRKALPQERLLYIADSSHAPYGDKSLDYIQQRALTLTRFLLVHGAKALVVASNTTTAAAVDLLRSTFPIPIVAVEPALKLAVTSTRTGVVGILVTVATSQSARFAALLERFKQDTTVIIQPAPGLVEQIEMGELTSPKTRALVKHYVTPLLSVGADTIVLGSTHYPHLRPLITEIVGPEVVLIDTGEAVAHQLRRVLEARELLNEDLIPGEAQFWTSGDMQLAQQVISLLWGTSVSVQQLPDAFM